MYEEEPQLSIKGSELFEGNYELLSRLIDCKNNDVDMMNRYDFSNQLTEEDWSKLEQVEALIESPLWKALL